MCSSHIWRPHLCSPVLTEKAERRWESWSVAENAEGRRERPMMPSNDAISAAGHIVVFSLVNFLIFSVLSKSYLTSGQCYQANIFLDAPSFQFLIMQQFPISMASIFLHEIRCFVVKKRPAITTSRNIVYLQILYSILGFDRFYH